MHAPRKVIVALASATAVGGAVFGLIVRPRISCWGATDEEVRRSLPGDELESPYGYRPISTRAIMESGMMLGVKARVEASSPIPRVSAAAAP